MKTRDILRRRMAEARRYRSLPGQALDIVRHKLRINVGWKAYYLLGFFRPEPGWEDKALYITSRGSRYWPFETNSQKFDRLFNYKGIQKAVLAGLGLPTPRLIAKVGDESPIRTPQAFAEAMRGVECGFVTKPDGSLGGAGVLAFEPAPGGFRCQGEVVDADWIWNRYANRTRRGFLVEERARNHPALAVLHPPSLNTLRLVTVKTRDGRWHVVRPYLKMGRGGSAADNVALGGLFAAVGPDGRLGPGYAEDSWECIESHPDTGVPLRGHAVPFFREAVDLALRASGEFGFMGTIGWDVGVTPDGPTLIEGNTLWGADFVQAMLGPFLTPEIAAGLMPRHWWTPWDRTHQYPKYLGDLSGGWWQRRLASRRRRWGFG